MIHLLAMAGQTGLPCARLTRQGRGRVAARSGARDVYLHVMRIAGGCLVTGDAVTRRFVVALMATRTRRGTGRRRCAAVALRTGRSRMDRVVERKAAAALMARDRDAHGLRIRSRRVLGGLVTAAARLGRRVPVMTRITILRRPDRDPAMRSAHVVAGLALDRAMLRVPERSTRPLHTRRRSSGALSPCR